MNGKRVLHDIIFLGSVGVYLHVGVFLCICLNFKEFVLERTSARFARSGEGILEASWEHLGSILGPSWSQVEAKLGQVGAKLGQVGVKLGPS